MTTTDQTQNRVPVVCADPSCLVGAELFNPNSWTGDSKGVIQSCWTEYSVLHYCVEQLSAMCEDAERLCASHVSTIQGQWKLAKFDLEKMAFFGQQPDLHIRIEGFFSGAKSLLDLMVQLLKTEKIVGCAVDGFHRDKEVYGGRVLNALRANAVKDRKDVAAKLEALISEHKGIWLDQLISARDHLVHPARGMQQLMFGMDFAERDGSLVCVKAHPPQIELKPIHSYAASTLKQLTRFSAEFVALTRGAMCV